MKKNHNRILSIAVVVAVVFAVYLAWDPVFKASGDKDSSAAMETSGEEGKVAVTEAVPGSISVKVEGPSVVEAYRRQEIRSRLAGTIVAAAEEGDRINRGDVLVSFDATELRNGQRSAELNLQQARVDLEKVELALESAGENLADRESLFAAGSISRAQLEEARQTAANAELAVRAARIKVDQEALNLETATELFESTEVRAPFSGVVLAADVHPGDVVSSWASLMTFADISKLRLRAEVDEFDIGKVEVAMPVQITSDSLGEESLRSVVERVSPAAEVVNNISIFTVSTVIPASENGLRPGMSADLTILISDDTGLIVPSGAVSSVRGRFYLEVFENGEVLTKRVTAGANDGVNVVITEGLEEGTRVVVPQTAGFTLGHSSSAPVGTSIVPINVPGTGGSR